jgi:hypothetical protein
MIRKLWARLVSWGWDHNYELTNKDDFDTVSLESISRPVIDIEGLSFNIMPAKGGVIVQLRSYDHTADRHITSTHIIAEGQDVAEEIGKIVAMELWKV